MEWQYGAACTGLPCDWFLEEEHGLCVCRGCNVRADCLDYGRANHLSGVWGGRRLINGKPKALDYQHAREAYDPEQMFEQHGVQIRIC